MMNLSFDQERGKFYAHQLTLNGYTLAETECLYNLAKNGYFHNANTEWLIMTTFEDGRFNAVVIPKAELMIVEYMRKYLALFSGRYGNMWKYVKIGLIDGSKGLIYAPLTEDGHLIEVDAQ